jgi:hypothetical protein
MAFPSTYSDGLFVVLDIDYALKSNWFDGRSNTRGPAAFNSSEFQKYIELAARLAGTQGTAFQASVVGLRQSYIPLIAKGDTFSFQSVAKEDDGSQLSRTRTGLRVQYYNTQTQIGEGGSFVFAAPSAALVGSLIKIADKVALSKALFMDVVYERVYNDTGSTLTAGTVVKYNGITSDGVVEVEPPDANMSDNNIIGILQEDILTAGTGACASINGGGAWIPSASLGSPNDGAAVYISSDTGALSHSVPAGGQSIGHLRHTGTGGGAHLISFATLSY